MQRKKSRRKHSKSSFMVSQTRILWVVIYIYIYLLNFLGQGRFLSSSNPNIHGDLDDVDSKNLSSAKVSCFSLH